MAAMRTAMALLALTLLAGCYTKYDLSGDAWTKAGATIQQVTQDEMDCVREAREAGATPDLYIGGLVDVGRYVVEEGQRRGAYQRCMTTKGYQPS
jgi:hypothetical protein